MTVKKWLLGMVTRYSRPKVVEYEDPYIAVAYWVMVLFVFGIYTVVYQICYEHAYAIFETPVTHMNIWTELFNTTESTSQPFCDPTNEFYLIGRGMSQAERSMLGYVLNEGATCINATTDRHVVVRESSMVFVTYEMVGGMDDPVLRANGRPRYFTKGIEGAILGFRIGVVTSWMREAEIMKHVRFYSVDGTELFPSYNDDEGFYALTLQTILDMANLSLDELNFYLPGLSDYPARRMTGTTLSLRFQCSNLRSFDWRNYGVVECVATTHPSETSWGDAGMQVVFEPPGSDLYEGTAVHSMQLGVAVHLQLTGMLGHVSSTEVLRLIIDALVLMTVAEIIINFFCENFLPGKEAFTSAFLEEVRLRILRRTPLEAKEKTSPSRSLPTQSPRDQPQLTLIPSQNRIAPMFEVAV